MAKVGVEGEVVQIIYTHVTTCKNDKIKFKKEIQRPKNT
jgi:hypothetical protein